MDTAALPLKILVAPLNWGLGHATRCIPIIDELIANGYTPILASDGMSLELLKKEYPALLALELPSYNIEYPQDGSKFKWKMLKNAPKMFDAIRSEKKIVKKWVKEFGLNGIISDNRLGVVSKKVPSVFITHQLNVLSGSTTWISTKMHQHIISKFVECWVPDFDSKNNLSGKLGHRKSIAENVRYIGPLSRFKKMELPIKYDLLVLLSGPEPQRTLLEYILRPQILESGKKVAFVCGKIEAEPTKSQVGNVTFYNFLQKNELQRIINESAAVLCRSGYSTLMDLCAMEKQCYLIPTPGQFEQEYLAARMKKRGFAPSTTQEEFAIENLTEMNLYQGLPRLANDVHWKHLFCLFKGK